MAVDSMEQCLPTGRGDPVRGIFAGSAIRVELTTVDRIAA